MRVLQLIIFLNVLASCSNADFDIVIRNGTIVVENGIHNGNRPGRVLRGPGYNL